MPTTDQQRDGWRLECATFEHIDTHVTDQVIHRIDRFVERNGKRLGGTDSNHERTGKPGPIGNRNRIDF